MVGITDRRPGARSHTRALAWVLMLVPFLLAGMAGAGFGMFLLMVVPLVGGITYGGLS